VADLYDRNALAYGEEDDLDNPLTWADPQALAILALLLAARKDNGHE